jgi:hypothetical protein
LAVGVALPCAALLMQLRARGDGGLPDEFETAEAKATPWARCWRLILYLFQWLDLDSFVGAGLAGRYISVKRSV